MMDFDEILQEIGEFGHYQLLLAILLCFPISFAYPYTFMGQMFQTLTPDHWCHVPELDNYTSMTMEQKKQLTIPIEIHDGISRYSQCSVYNFEPNFSWPLTENIDVIGHGTIGNGTGNGSISSIRTWTQESIVDCKHGWDYDFDNYKPTATSDFDWVCGNSWRGYASLAIFFFGSTFGCLIFGFISDSYGRRPTALLVNGLALSANVASAFTQGFASFTVIRFIAGTTFDMSFMVYLILVLEYIGPKHRNIVANIGFGSFFTLGSAILPWLSYWVPNWRYFSIVMAIPFLFSLPLYNIIPESARWLISQNRYDEAMIILKKIAKINKRDKTETFWNSIKINLANDRSSELNDGTTHTALDLFRKPRLRMRIIVTSLSWFVVLLTYDALVRNTENLGWNVYMSSTFGNLTELPAALIPIFVLDRIGRRISAFISFMMASILSLTVVAIPTDKIVIFVTLNVLARLFATISMNIFIIYMTELFPTVLRGQAVSLVHVAGFVGSSLSPFVVILGHISKEYPLIIIGGVSMLGAIFVTLLPETLNEALPDTYKEGEEFGRGQSFFYYPSRNPKVANIRT